MKCVRCKGPSHIKVQNLEVCTSCFLKIIEKRVRREVRQKNLFAKSDSILIIDDGTARAKVGEFILKDMLSHLSCDISISCMKYALGQKISTGADKVVIPWSADDEGSYFLDMIIQGKSHDYSGHFEQDGTLYVKLLLPVLIKEIRLFADIKGFTYEKEQTNDIDDMLHHMQKEYPGITFSLLRSATENL